MSREQAVRLTYEESCELLQRHHYLSAGNIPEMPDGRPDIYGERGVSFFRTWIGVGRPFGLEPSRLEDDVEVAEHALANLTLPRTFFGKSEISFISFQNTDLTESTLCWNDFIEVDFTDADLSGADLRASIFRTVCFVRADLRNADLRHSTFEECDFTDADMTGAKLTRERAESIHLSELQQAAIDWQAGEGDEPLGG